MLVRKSVRKLVGYTPGEQPKAKKVVKLNTNENPYPPSPACAAVLSSFDLDRLRRYPDPMCTELRAALAALHATVPERIFVGNGSDEILSLAARAFVEDDEEIASLDPSYSLYQTLAAIRAVPWRGQTPPVAARLRPQISLFLWTNPNAPTGQMATREEIAAFARQFKGVCLVDEAYADFAETNCVSLATAKQNRNVVVMRTFSKSFSLAGLRVGYCIGPEKLIEALYKVKDSYNVDALAQALALAAVKDYAWMLANVKKVRRTRAALTEALEQRGWEVLPSQANFVFARPPAGDAARLFAALRERQIFVRYFPGPKTGDRLRITIGTEAQVRRLLKELDALSV